jgi:nucleoside-diphosphate-sugar epimerase
MSVAITAADGFVGPWISEMLGDDAILVPDEALKEPLTLDAMLTPCTTVIHINSTASAGNAGRDDREAMLVMRERSRPVLDAVQRHGGLHLILVGTLRVHPQWEEGEPYYGSDSTVAPRDVAAEGQLWMEERALEQATPERPVSVIRASNVQGVPISGPPGNGLLHKWASEAPIGWVNVPGDGSGLKDFIHVQDLVECIMGVASDPPPTRESIAIGSGKGIQLRDLAGIYNQMTGCEAEYGQNQ